MARDLEPWRYDHAAAAVENPQHHALRIHVVQRQYAEEAVGGTKLVNRRGVSRTRHHVGVRQQYALGTTRTARRAHQQSMIVWAASEQHFF